MLATACSKREVKRARESVCYAPCCSARLAASASEADDHGVFFGARRMVFFPSAAFVRDAGGALESDGTAASSFPLVSGIQPAPRQSGASEQLRSAATRNRKQRSLSSRSCCAPQRLRNGTREHTHRLKIHTALPVIMRCGARAAPYSCLAPRTNRPASHIATRRHAQADEPHRARAVSQHGRRPVTTTSTSASPQLMTTKHERRTSPRRNMHTQLKSSSSRNTDA